MKPYRDFGVAVAIAFGLFLIAVSMIVAGRATESLEPPAMARDLNMRRPS